MVVELVKTAIETKCAYENAGMTGNYECAYALGIISANEGLKEQENISGLKELYDEVISDLGSINTDNKKLKQLIKITSDYEVTNKFDSQMEQLYHMGYKDKILN